MFGSDEDLDAAWLSWLSFDEAGSFEGKDHLMDRWRGDLEVALHVGFGGRSSVDAGVGVNEGEILSLLFGEAGLRRGVTGIGGLIHQSFFQQGGPDEHTIPRRLEPMRACGTDGAFERRQLPASSSGRRSCWPPMPAPATRRSRPGWWSAAPRSIAPSFSNPLSTSLSSSDTKPHMSPIIGNRLTNLEHEIYSFSNVFAVPEVARPARSRHLSGIQRAHAHVASLKEKNHGSYLS